jgi:hypothetical protein
MSDNSYSTTTVIVAAAGAAAVGGVAGYAAAAALTDCLRIQLPLTNFDCINNAPTGARCVWDSGFCWVKQFRGGYECYQGQTRSCSPSGATSSGGTGGTAGGLPLCTAAGGGCGVQYCVATSTSGTWETACHATTP